MLNEYPKISIITPNFNKGDTLDETIQSILSQGYPNLEYIIIDGGSTDISLEIIGKYKDKITHFISEPDNGMYDALKKGANLCSGEIMTWLGADDKLHTQSLFTVAEIFSNFKDVLWLTGANTLYDKYGRTVSVSRSRYLNRLDLLSYDYKWIQQESTFWRKSLYDKVGGIDSSLKLAGDFDLWVKFSRHTKLFNCDALIGGFRSTLNNQLSNDKDAYYREVKEIIKREWDLYPKDRKKVNRILWKRRIVGRLHLPYQWFLSKAKEVETKNQRIDFDYHSQTFVKQ